MDVDLVIAPTATALYDFVQRTAALGLYVSADAAREAFAHQGIFSVVDPETGWNADLIIFESGRPLVTSTTIARRYECRLSVGSRRSYIIVVQGTAVVSPPLIQSRV